MRLNRFMLLPVLSCAIALTPAPGTFNNAAYADGDSARIMKSDELQWIIGVPDAYWTQELQTILNALEAKQPKAANAALKDWLNSDFEAATLALPHIGQVYFYFEPYKDGVTNAYADRLEALPGKEQMEILGVLGLEKTSVRFVAVELMRRRWEKDPKAFRRWLIDTPSLFQDLYIEQWVEAVEGRSATPDVLAALFYDLRADDSRKQRFFASAISDWMDRDPQGAVQFISHKYEIPSQDSKTVLDRAALMIGYYYSNARDHENSLIWASRIKSPDSREHAIREFIVTINDAPSVMLYQTWLADNPISNPIIRQDVDAHFQSVLNPSDPLSETQE